MAFDFNKFINSPLTHIGIGLLGQAGSPNGWVGVGRGVQNGLLSYSTMQDRIQERDIRKQQAMLANLRMAQLAKQISDTNAINSMIDNLPVPDDVKIALKSDPELLRKYMEVSNGLDVPSPGRQDYEMRKAAAGATRINLEKPMSVSDLQNLRDEHGNPPPVGTSISDIRKSGKYKVVSPQEQKIIQQKQMANSVLDQMGEILIGDDKNPGILKGVTPSLVDRGSKSIEAGWNLITQQDPRYSTYEGLATGTLAPLVKALGESGNLATEDIERAQKLISDIFPIPDTESVAREKLNQLRQIINKGVRNMEQPKRKKKYNSEAEAVRAMGLKPVGQ